MASNFLTADNIQYVSISASSSGNNTILAAAGANQKIVVLSYVLVAATAVAVKFQSGAGGTDLCGAMTIGGASDSGGIVVPFSPQGHFKTAANTLLNLNLSGAIQVSGHLTYVVINEG